MGRWPGGGGGWDGFEGVGVNLQSLSSLGHLSRCSTQHEHCRFHLLDSRVGIVHDCKRKGVKSQTFYLRLYYFSR